VASRIALLAARGLPFVGDEAVETGRRRNVRKLPLLGSYAASHPFSRARAKKALRQVLRWLVFDAPAQAHVLVGRLPVGFHDRREARSRVARSSLAASRMAEWRVVGKRPRAPPMSVSSRTAGRIFGVRPAVSRDQRTESREGVAGLDVQVVFAKPCARHPLRRLEFGVQTDRAR
jgi:hypothetical protein